MKLTINRLLILTLVLIFSGCTFYTFVDGSSKYNELKKIRVKQFENNAGNGPPDLQVTFTEKTKDFFLQNGKFELAELNEDLLLECKINSYQSGISGGTSQGTSAQSKLTIRVEVKFTDYQNPDNNLEKTFEGREFYDRNQDLNSIESDLIGVISDQIVTDIFNGTTMKNEW